MDQANGKGENASGSETPVYVNHCDIVANLSDAKLTFAQAGDGQEPPKVKARLVTSPTHLARFRDVITHACRQHEEQFARDIPDSDTAGES